MRPEDVREAAEGEDFLFEGKIAIIEALGEVTLIYIEGDLIDEDPIIVKLPGIHKGKPGDVMRFVADSERLHLFDESGHSYLYR